MKRIEFLMDKIRKSTDTRQSNGLLDNELLDYFNIAQSMIQSVIFSFEERPSIFLIDDFFISSVTNTQFYDLPSDMFAENAIFIVEEESNTSNVYYPLRRIDPTEKKLRKGYYVQNRKISFSPQNDYNQADKWKITYIEQLPLLDKRRGTIQSHVSGASITLSAGYDASLDEVDDYISVIDKEGTIIQKDIYITGFNSGTGVITTSDALTISNGQFVVMGKKSSTHTKLPDACESVLLDIVRQRVLNRDASQKVADQSTLSDQQLQILKDIFSNHTSDVTYPPTTDTDYLGL